METSIHNGLEERSGFGRFEGLLSADSCGRAQYDEVLCEVDGCAVAPTLGSILPYWLLVVPRVSAVNFRRWAEALGREPYDLVKGVLVELDVCTDRVIWFEHGPADRASPLSCGVDHAHLHVIIDAPFCFDDFVAVSSRTADIGWKEVATSEAYGAIRSGGSYLFAAAADRAVIAENVDHAGSQFFRRIVAELSRRSNEWDYRAYPQIGNIQKTLNRFGGYAGATTAR